MAENTIDETKEQTPEQQKPAQPQGRQEEQLEIGTPEYPSFDEGMDAKPAGDILGVDGKSMELLQDVSLEVTVELGRAKTTIGEVLELGQGSVIELNITLSDRDSGLPAERDPAGLKPAVRLIDTNVSVRDIERACLVQHNSICRDLEWIVHASAIVCGRKTRDASDQQQNNSRYSGRSRHRPPDYFPRDAT